MKNEIKHENAIRYMLGGKAYVNIHNESTNNQRRFFILAVNNEGHTRTEVRNFILDHYKVFCCPIGEKKKIFVGFIKDGIFTMTRLQHEEFAKNFNWIWKHLNERDLTSDIHILHLGSCSVCGRPLIDAPSLEIGIGPICLKRIQSHQNAETNN